MPEFVPMPKLGFDMAEGKLVRKVKREGESVKKGDVLAEIETDKATVEVPAPSDGVVKGWVVEEGQPVPVGALMAVLGAADESVDLVPLRGGPGGAAPAVSARPAASPAAGAPPPLAAPAGESAPASPVARRMASEAGIDIRLIAGTGPGGRVTRKDVEAYLAAAPATPAAAAASPAAPAPVSAVAPTPEDQIVPLTRLRQIIARRMTESTQQAPQFYVTTDIDMAAAMDLRRQINAVLPEERKISVNDLIVKAAALALREFPNLNATFAGDRVVRKGRVNIGIAVAVEGGLLTVVVKDADRKKLAEIAAEARVLVARARAGKVQGDDIEGSTFSVSNLGMYEVDNFIAILNPPEAGILATGAVRETPVVKDGALVPGLRLKATCSADHRVTDGAEVARFLRAVRQSLEEPFRLVA